MANLPEVAQWTSEEDGIYQFELDDFITGGPGGNDNEPHRLLANRTRFLKERQENIIEDISKIGGFKNLWVNGAMSVWVDGIAGDFSASHDPRYLYGIVIGRHHSNYDENGNFLNGVGGSVYHWERVLEADKQWLKLTHAGAVESGYIGQRWDRSTLQYLKGETVTLSFLYKCGTDMKGNISFYNEQDIIHDGIGTRMAHETVQYIGDNEVHKMEVTVTLGTDNIVPDANAYFGIQLGYGGNIDGMDAIPNGSIQFTEIQLEVNDEATDFEHIPDSITELQIGYYYQKSPSWVLGHRIYSSAYRVGLSHTFPIPMRKTPFVNITALAKYNASATLIGVAFVSGTTKTGLASFVQAATELDYDAYILKYTADARIY